MQGRFQGVAFTTLAPFTEDKDDLRYNALTENHADLYNVGLQLVIPVEDR